MMAAYVEFIRIRFLMMLAYRVNYYSGIAVYAINIGAYYFVWQAVYANSAGTIGGFTASQMTTYIAIAWMARAFYFNNLDKDIAREIRDGSVAIELIRPYSYLLVKLMQGLGEGLFRLLLFSTPGMLIIAWLLPIQFPTDGWLWVQFLWMLFCSFMINSQLNIIVGMGAFFLENNEGLMRMKRVAVDLLSGLIVPLTFFPSWAQPILEALPFQAITYLPTSVITQRIVGEALFGAFLTQLAWIVVLWVPIVWLWSRARRRLFVQGG